MSSGLRTLSFGTDLHLPPTPEFKIKPAQVHSLFNKMHEPGGYPYESLEKQIDRYLLTTKREGGKSVCQLGPDMIRIEEEKPEMPLNDFDNVVQTVIKALPGVGPFFLQRCRAECLVQVQSEADSRVLLAGKIANVLDRINPFERPPSYFGVRFRFEPQFADDNDKDEDDENDNPIMKPSTDQGELIHTGFMQARFETYSKDKTQVWIEVTATYPEVFIPETDLEKIVQNIKQTYDFLSVKCKAFIDQFDSPKKKGG
jgi:hypothetical protein